MIANPSVASVVEDPRERALELSARPIGLHGVGRSASVTYTSPVFWQDPGNTRLLERDPHEATQDFQAGFNLDLPPRLPLYPPDPNLTSVPEDIIECVFTHPQA